MPGQEQLQKEVMERDLCSSCGICVGLCPYIKTVRDRVKVIYPCGHEEGTCYSVCPKTPMDIADMDRAVFGREREDQSLGLFSGIYYARTLAGKPGGSQYGGVTSALTGLALREGLISSAVLTGGDITSPRPVLARDAGAVERCAGSKYTGVPTLLELNRAIRDGLTNIGVVGRPCQVLAVRKSQRGNLPGQQYPSPSGIGLVLGLFCFWSLSPELYGFLQRETGGGEIVRMDIPLEGPVAYTKTGQYSWPLDDIRPFIKEACSSCFDSTSEYADISVGSTEQDPTWNTLIIRSAKGADIVDLALRKGVIEVSDYPAERLPLLRKAALGKKIRALALLEKESGSQGYITMPDKYRQDLESQWGGIDR
jgi:coenzyme F420-reducing hydrogenase beta subunit